MQVLESRPTIAPGVCFICEMSPDEMRWIDTLRSADFYGFEGGEIPTHLTGRKYVCESCITTMARLLGWAPEEEVVETATDGAVAEARFNGLKETLERVLEEA